MRNDLLALTTDDLVLLANRGLARRAAQEIAGGQLTYQLAEDDDGTLTVRWSDDVTCMLPGNKPASGGRCSCPATTICRHLLRSILAYQEHIAAQQPEQTAGVRGPWDPGAIPDTQLAQAIARGAMTWARQAFEAGQVIELVRAAKPTATLHSLACTVRFLVPDDIRYTYCDCAEAAPCRHVPLAVWAFRRLDSEQVGGIVEIPPPAGYVAPAAFLDELEAALRELAGDGMSSAPQVLIERLRRLELRARVDGLIWPADALADLVREHTAYTAHDARFEPLRLGMLIGELCVRADAIQAQMGAVPQLFVRGSSADTETAIGTARLIGLGCGAHIRRGGIDLASYLQDADTGAAMAVLREHNDPAEDRGAPPAPLWQLAQVPVAQGVGLSALGSGQTLIKGGRRLPSARFVPGRARLTLNPQNYAWESLHAPLFAEDIAELTARIALQPPQALRPRRVTDGLHVCAVAGAEGTTFSSIEQAVRATLRDAQGATMTLLHPFVSRASAGTTALLAALQSQSDALRFVAGHVRLTPAGPVVAPTALVFQEGPARRAVLPWVDKIDHQEEVGSETQTGRRRQPLDPLAEYWSQVEDALGELLVIGLRRPDERMAQRWRELARFGGALGFARLLAPVERLATELERRRALLGWTPELAVEAALQIARVTQVIGGGLSR